MVGIETSSSSLAIKSKDGSKGRRRKLTAANVELIERKVKHLKEDNKKLQEEATEVRILHFDGLNYETSINLYIFVSNFCFS